MLISLGLLKAAQPRVDAAVLLHIMVLFEPARTEGWSFEMKVIEKSVRDAQTDRAREGRWWCPRPHWPGFAALVRRPLWWATE
jgi:hypothetical protein